MRTIPVFALALAVAAAAAADGSATAWSPAAAVDLSSHASRRAAPAEVSYAPDFVAGGSADGSVELLGIRHAGTFNASTQTIISATSPASGTVTLGALGDAAAIRLVLRSFDATGTFVGEISADIALGAMSAFSADTFADMESGKLDRAIASGSMPGLVYSDTWTDGVAALAIDALLENGTVRNLFEAVAPADGMFGFAPVGRKKTSNLVRLHFLDSAGGELCDPLVAAYTGTDPFETVMILR